MPEIHLFAFPLSTTGSHRLSLGWQALLLYAPAPALHTKLTHVPYFGSQYAHDRNYSSHDHGHTQHPSPPPPPHSAKSVTAPMSEPWQGGPPPSQGPLCVWQSGPCNVEGEVGWSDMGELRTPPTLLLRPAKPRWLPESILVASLSSSSPSSTLPSPLSITHMPSECAVKLTPLQSPRKDE